MKKNQLLDILDEKNHCNLQNCLPMDDCTKCIVRYADNMGYLEEEPSLDNPSFDFELSVEQAEQLRRERNITNKSRRSWKNFINKNSPNTSDCQIVSAVNAYYYLTGRIIIQGSKLYEKLIDLGASRCGPAASIEKVYEYLGIKIIRQRSSVIDFEIRKTFKYLLPLEAEIWHKKTGRHSCLIIEHNRKNKAFRVTNFPQVTTELGWIFEEDFWHYTHHLSSFKLLGLKI